MPTPAIPLTTYLSPCRQFARFRVLREQYSDRAVLTRDRLRKEREAWVAAFLMGYGELTDRFLWLTICPAISPDSVAIAPRKEARGWIAERLTIAILEQEEHAPVAGLAAAVERTMRGKAYPADHRLVCYVRHRPGAALNAGAIAARLRDLALPRAEAWLAGSVGSDQFDDYVVSRLHPAPWEYRLSYLQYCAETPQFGDSGCRAGRERGDLARLHGDRAAVDRGALRRRIATPRP